MINKRTIYAGLIALFMCFSALGQNAQNKVWTLEECVNYAWENNLTVRTNQLNQLQNEIGRQLNVEHLLEGSVRKSGERVRIVAQLIKVDDGYHLWSERYDRVLEDVFEA